MDALSVDTGDDRDVLGTAERHQVARPDCADREDAFLERAVTAPGEVQDHCDRCDRVGDLESRCLQRVADEDAAPGRAVVAEVRLKLVQLRPEIIPALSGSLPIIDRA